MQIAVSPQTVQVCISENHASQSNHRIIKPASVSVRVNFQKRMVVFGCRILKNFKMHISTERFSGILKQMGNIKNITVISVKIRDNITVCQNKNITPSESPQIISTGTAEQNIILISSGNNVISVSTYHNI